MSKKLKMTITCFALLAICVVVTYAQRSMLRYGNRSVCIGYHSVAVGPRPHFANWQRTSSDPVLMLVNRYQFRFPVQQWLQLQYINPATGEVQWDIEFPIRSNIHGATLSETEDVMVITRGHWIDDSGEIILFSLEANEVPKRLVTIKKAEFAEWHPNELVLATIFYPEGYRQGSNIVALYDVSGLNPQQIDAFRLKWVAINRFFGWSYDGHVFAVSQLDNVGEIPYYIFVDEGRVEKSLYQESSHNCISNGQWSPTEPVLAFSGTNVETQGWDIFLERVVASDGKEKSLINLTKTPEADERDVVWSPNGERIAYVKLYKDGEDNLRQELFVINLNDTSPTPRQLTDSPDDSANKPIWLSDSEIAYLSWSLTEHTWSLMNISLIDSQPRKIMDIPQVWYREQ